MKKPTARHVMPPPPNPYDEYAHGAPGMPLSPRPHRGYVQEGAPLTEMPARAPAAEAYAPLALGNPEAPGPEAPGPEDADFVPEDFDDLLLVLRALRERARAQGGGR